MKTSVSTDAALALVMQSGVALSQALPQINDS